MRKNPKYTVHYGSWGPEIHPYGDTDGTDIIAIIPHEREDAELVAALIVHLLETVTIETLSIKGEDILQNGGKT